MEERIKMFSNGVTIFVLPREVDFFKRAGYEVVIEKKASPKNKDAEANKE